MSLFTFSPVSRATLSKPALSSGNGMKKKNHEKKKLRKRKRKTGKVRPSFSFCGVGDGRDLS
jgi:hypothetical protein